MQISIRISGINWLLTLLLIACCFQPFHHILLLAVHLVRERSIYCFLSYLSSFNLTNNWKYFIEKQNSKTNKM